MTSARQINDVAGSAQQWLQEERSIEDLEFRAELLNREAEALETQATKALKQANRRIQKDDDELNDLKAREKQIKEGDQIVDATRKLADLKKTTGLAETEDQKKARQETLKADAENDDEVQELRNRAEEKRLEAQQMGEQAQNRRKETESAGEAIIERVAGLASLPLE